jgi:hypothetical protein
MTNVCQNSSAFLAVISLLEGRMGTDIQETLTLLVCADYSTFCAFLGSCLPFFWPFVTLRVFFASGADGEAVCHSQEQLKPCEREGLNLVVMLMHDE